MKTILVPVDFSDATPQVVDVASKMARAFGGKIVLLHVSEPEPDFIGFEPGPQTVRTVVAHDFKGEHQQLDMLKARLAAEGLEMQALHFQGPTVDKILHEAEQAGAELIVMGSHGHGSLYELLVGSVTQGVMKGAHCPVVVVPVVKK